MDTVILLHNNQPRIVCTITSTSMCFSLENAIGYQVKKLQPGCPILVWCTTTDSRKSLPATLDLAQHGVHCVKCRPAAPARLLPSPCLPRTWRA